jgi:hypothetical protein
MKQSCVVALIAALLLLAAAPAAAAPLTRERGDVQRRTAAASRTAAELPARPYPQYAYYSELAGELAALARRAPDRVTVLKQSRSANGHPLYLVVVTAKMSRRQLQVNDVYRAALRSDPRLVLDQGWLSDGSGIRPAVFINAGIHGHETTGMDAALRLLRRLAFGKDALTRRIISSLIVVVNPCQNPDGRIADVRENGNGFDLNRDFVALTQPETRQTVRAIRTWLPLVLTDLHGFVSPTLIEPTTFPHNPALEYDLLRDNALHVAQAQAAAVARETGYASQIPALWGTAADKTGSANEGWDDYAPYYTGQIAQQYGALGQTVETAVRGQDGVAIHYWAAWEAVRQCLAHRWRFAAGQAELLARGDEGVSAGRPWPGGMQAMLRSADPRSGEVVDAGWFLADGTRNPAFPYSNEVGAITFPYAHVIPVDPALQPEPAAALKFVRHALMYGVEVERALDAFAAGAVTYPSGTYVVRTAQPLRALAQNLLWDGEDVRSQYGVSSMYDVAVWSLPHLWGFTRTAVPTAFSAELEPVTSATPVSGAVDGEGPLYSLAGDGIAAIKAVNHLLRLGVRVGMVTRPPAAAAGLAVGSFVVDARAPGTRACLRRLSAQLGLRFATATGATLAQTALLGSGRQRLRVRVNASAEAVWVLRSVLGFDRTESALRPQGDVFVNASAHVDAVEVRRWLDGDPSSEDGRRTYIGIDTGGSSVVSLVPGAARSVDPDPLVADNGLCPVVFSAEDVQTAGYPAAGYVFAGPAVWFQAGAGAVDVTTPVMYRGGAGGVYEWGFWNAAAGTAGGAGKAALLTYEPRQSGARGRVVLMGFSPLYRGQPEGSFLLVARQILLAGAAPPEET